jgi:hypothetical protein
MGFSGLLVENGLSESSGLAVVDEAADGAADVGVARSNVMTSCPTLDVLNCFLLANGTSA